MSAAPDRQPSSSRRFDTSILMAVAALLIINSHLEDFYPKRWLAADGLLGVMFFYFLSGYGIQCSLQARSQSFGQYLWRRVLRLYPALVIVSVATLLFRKSDLGNLTPLHWLEKLIWPTDYTYYKWILPFYIALYFIGYRATPKRYLVIMPLMLIAYSVSAMMESMRSDFPTKLQLGNLSQFNQTMTYALGFFSGAAIATLTDRIILNCRQVIGLIMLWVVVLGIYLAAKFEMVVREEYSRCFSLLHGCVLILCIAGFLITSWTPLVNRIRSIRPVWIAISLLSVITLETYLIHEPLAHWSDISEVRFPANILLLLAITIILSIPLHFITTLRKPWVK